MRSDLRIVDREIFGTIALVLIASLIVGVIGITRLASRNADLLDERTGRFESIEQKLDQAIAELERVKGAMSNNPKCHDCGCKLSGRYHWYDGKFQCPPCYGKKLTREERANCHVDPSLNKSHDGRPTNRP